MTIRFHDRWLLDRLRHRLAAPGLHVLVGGRRTGKTTLIDALLPSEALRVTLANPAERARFLWRPQDLSALCHAVPRSTAHPTLWIDDVHLVPELLDVARTVVARERRGWRIIVTTLFEQAAAGSVVRAATRVQPLLLAEHPAPPHVLPVAGESPLVVPWPGGPGRRWSFPAWTLGERLAFGSLPGVVLTPERERAGSLRQQALALLEEDVRRHTPIRDWPGFMRFARQAALESGRVQNLAGIANETGLSAPTVRAYYVLLERLGMIVRVPGWTKGPRSNYLSTPWCYLFDLGIRHALAGRRIGNVQ